MVDTGNVKNFAQTEREGGTVKKTDCGVGEWLSPDVNTVAATKPEGTTPDDLDGMDVLDYYSTFYGDKILDAISDIAELGAHKTAECNDHSGCAERFYSILSFLKMYRAGNEALINGDYDHKGKTAAA